MGRSVGKTIAGSPQPFVKVPVFWSARESQLYKAAIDDVITVDNHRGSAATLLRHRIGLRRHLYSR
jgi:hypothetical protein